MSVRNILAVYGQATDQERKDGRLWYTTANATACGLGYAYRAPVVQVAGVIAALSPRSRWERNLIDATAIYTATRGASEETYTAFKQNVDKAKRIAASAFDVGEVLDLLGNGPKTRAFFWNIYNPEATEHVTIDGHATTISEGKYRPLASLPSLTKRRYAILSDEYRRAATLAGTTPNVMQATTWIVWRRIHGIG